MWPWIRSVGDARCATGVGPSFVDLVGLKGTYARLIYTGSWTRPLRRRLGSAWQRTVGSQSVRRRTRDAAVRARRIDAELVALDLGDRLEQSFGTTHRRHLANRGEYEGRFDPRFNW